MSYAPPPNPSTPLPRALPSRAARPSFPSRTPYSTGGGTPSTSHYGSGGGVGISQALNSTSKFRQLTRDERPLPLYHSIGTGQARFSTYPNRLKLGTTALVQPLASVNAGPSTSTAVTVSGTNSGGGGSVVTPSVLGKRQRTVINYAEFEGGEEEDSDDSDYGNGGGERERGGGRDRRRRRGADKEREREKMIEDAPWGEGHNFLDQKPPGNLIYAKVAPKTSHAWLSEKQLEEQAAETTLLIPITIELSTDHHRISDAFMWNLNEKLITPEQFAQTFCKDIDIPLQPHADLVANSIKSQIEEHTSLFEFLQVDNQQTESEPEKRVTEQEGERKGETEVNGVGKGETKLEQDLRVVINLDVQIQTLHLTDKLEWDLHSSLTPEIFSRLLCSDLALTSSSAPLISHALHSELIKHRRECLELGLSAGAKTMKGVWREWKEVLEGNWGPRVQVKTVEEVEKGAADKERAIRRMRRDTSRFQAAVQVSTRRRR